ncbi:(2Fe-2S)-binding protein [Zobellella maritima]|uniref:(2Fe-2S)-binding protein n=1 Tax=Zobellella maritima TaxID=2059725 RepID=UPI000E30B0F8|nr:(2Fe-2S)-binding protein [Zobellella maritima]
MQTDSPFNRLDTTITATVNIEIDGRPFSAREGDSVAAAMLAAGCTPSRTTPVSGSPRAPYCMMGICFECLVEIDGLPNVQGCMVQVTEGMKVRRQLGARELAQGDVHEAV